VLHAKQHAAATANLHRAVFGYQDDFAARIGPSLMSNRYVRKTIGTASIRGENPERLRPIVSIDRATAVRILVRIRLGEHSVIGGTAHYAIAVIDLAAFSGKRLRRQPGQWAASRKRHFLPRRWSASARTRLPEWKPSL